jgi:hypothetical protein
VICTYCRSMSLASSSRRSFLEAFGGSTRLTRLTRSFIAGRYRLGTGSNNAEIMSEKHAGRSRSPPVIYVDVN